jgi:hypothetical protein
MQLCTAVRTAKVMCSDLCGGLQEGVVGWGCRDVWERARAAALPLGGEPGRQQPGAHAAAQQAQLARLARVEEVKRAVGRRDERAVGMAPEL